jgi:hypothetical protein
MMIVSQKVQATLHLAATVLGIVIGQRLVTGHTSRTESLQVVACAALQDHSAQSLE